MILSEEEEQEGLLLLGLLGKEHSLNVWQHTSLRNGDSREELIKFLVIADGQLKVTWDDASLLVVAGGVTGELEDLSSQVLHNCCKVHGSTGTYTLGVIALSKEAMNPADGELKSSTTGTGL